MHKCHVFQNMVSSAVVPATVERMLFYCNPAYFGITGKSVRIVAYILVPPQCLSIAMSNVKFYLELSADFLKLYL